MAISQGCTEEFVQPFLYKTNGDERHEANFIKQLLGGFIKKIAIFTPRKIWRQKIIKLSR